MVLSETCDPPRQLAWQARLLGKFRSRLITSFVLLLALSSAAVTLQTDRRLGRELRATQPPPELIYLPPSRFLKAASLGYRNVLADVLWFRTISYFGQHYWSDRFYPWLAAMCNAVTDLDPHAQYVYRFGGLILPWEANRTGDGLALLRKGTRNLPRSWELRYMLGFSEYFFENDLAAASRSLRAAAVLPGAPPFVAGLAAIVAAAESGPAAAIEFLSRVESTGKTAEVRSALADRIRQLTVARDIDALQAAVASFQVRFRRPPRNLQELVTAGILLRLPVEPYGGQYLLDPLSGRVRSSSGHKPWRLGSSKRHQDFLKSRALGE
jgi:hypothetical protein